MAGRGAFRIRLGTLHLTAVPDRNNSNPWNELVVDVPADGLEEIRREAGFNEPQAVLGTNLVLVEVGDRLILVDTGLARGERLLDLLVAGGIEPGAVDTVVLTHSDGDHVGGLMAKNRLVLPGAKYVMHGDAWKWWTSEAYLNLGGGGSGVCDPGRLVP